MSDELQPISKEKLRLLLRAKSAGVRQALEDGDIQVSSTSTPKPAANWDYMEMDADPRDGGTFCNADPSDPVHHLWPNPYLYVVSPGDDDERS